MNTVIHRIKSWLGYTLTCEEVNRFIIDYLEGTLPPRSARLFEKHVAQCPNCDSYFNQYKTTVELLREQGKAAPDPPDELVEATMAFLKEHIYGESN